MTLSVFMCLFAICASSLVKLLIPYFNLDFLVLLCTTSVQFSEFFIDSRCESFVRYVVVNIFSQSMDHLFILIGSFAEQKSQNFMKPKLPGFQN